MTLAEFCEATYGEIFKCEVPPHVIALAKVFEREAAKGPGKIVKVRPGYQTCEFQDCTMVEKTL